MRRSIQVRGGTCSSLGVVRATLYQATSDATGWIDTIRNVPEGKMNDIWASARTGTILLRMGTGTIAKCARLGFDVATRITMSSLGIDLPVIRGPSGYPPCRVAMYIVAKRLYSSSTSSASAHPTPRPVSC